MCLGGLLHQNNEYVPYDFNVEFFHRNNFTLINIRDSNDKIKEKCTHMQTKYRKNNVVPKATRMLTGLITSKMFLIQL